MADAARQWCDLCLEASAIDDGVDLVLLSVDDRAPLGDPLDAGRAVDEGDVVAVVRVEVLVVEAGSLAQVAVIRFEPAATSGLVTS